MNKTERIETSMKVLEFALIADGREPLPSDEAERLVRRFDLQAKIVGIALILIEALGTMVVGGLIGLMFGLPVLASGIALFFVRRVINFDRTPYSRIIHMFQAARLIRRAKERTKKVGAPYMGFGGGDLEVNPDDIQKFLTHKN